jgi:hypothetical protein
MKHPKRQVDWHSLAFMGSLRVMCTNNAQMSFHSYNKNNNTDSEGMADCVRSMLDAGSTAHYGAGITVRMPTD